MNTTRPPSTSVLPAPPEGSPTEVRRSGRSGNGLASFASTSIVDRPRPAASAPRRAPSVGSGWAEATIADLDDADHLLLAVGHDHLDPTGGPGGGVDVGA